MSERRKSSETRGDRSDSYESKPRLDDYPPNSRLFIVCSRNITEEEFQDAFQKFGTIEEIWTVRDKTTKQPKGVTYIKFSKTSEAALALEEMNGRCIASHPRPLKVMIAHSRDQGSKREMNESERLLRLFCVVPKTMTDQELREHFQEFGDIDYVSIVKDRETRESKGFAYVKFHKVSHAAKAYEGCDRSFKAVFAEPKRQAPRDNPFPDRFSSASGSGGGMPGGGVFDNAYTPFNSRGVPHEGSGKVTLRVIAPGSLTQDQLWRLFDLVPGLDYLQCDPKLWMGKQQATAVYNSAQAAAYALDRLHGFEYPPGYRLIVKMDPDRPLSHVSASRDPFSAVAAASSPRLGTASPGIGSVGAVSAAAALTPDLATLAETIAQATSIIQAAGLAPGKIKPADPGVTEETYDPSYCSVKLPPPQPLAPVDSDCAERLFIVCNPSPPPSYAVRDVFGRFGHLIDVYLLNGKNYGYVKYASKESANKAIQVLHGQEICGVRLKVMAADPRTDDRRKRLRVDDQ
ncbi:RNA-binding protein 45 isoform X1 [Schistocerca gregaria]|uniref:RNA-binding protein 45 isoform X1 n=1 Tax=Schistocerca gregaria TaxID=7010 RepID=UPI00211F1957|nr:RNA-binding protein 45 isoform X1 [Schistocerca gregaria]